MGVQVKTVVLDDVDGQELDPGTRPIRLTIDRRSWDLYLAEENAASFYEAIEKFTANAQTSRQTDPSKARPSKTASPGNDASAIREWAKANAHDVPDRGRIPKAVREAYAQAH